MTPVVRLGAPLAAALALFAAAPPARAQSESELATRRALLDEAGQARTRGDHARAAELAQRAGQIQWTPSVRVFLAEELIATRRPVGAFNAALACVREAEADAALRNREAILVRCRELDAAARAQVARVTVRVPESLRARARVTLNGEPLSAALYDTATLVDPGETRVVIEVDGGEVVRRTLTLATASSDVVELRASDVAAARPGGPGVSPPAVPAPRRPALAGPVALLGAGAAGFVLAAVFFEARQASLSGCAVLPDAVECNSREALQRADEDAPRWNTATNVSLAVGAVALAAGGTWLTIELVRARGGSPGASAQFNGSGVRVRF